MFFTDGNFLYSRFKICCFHVANFVADGKALPKNYVSIFIDVCIDICFA